MIEPAALPKAESQKPKAYFCNNCSHDWAAFATNASAPRMPSEHSRRYRSLDELIARTGLRRDEVVTLADIGALNSFGYDRRSALWQAERAVRPTGELFTELAAEHAEFAEISLDQMDSADSASFAADLVPSPGSPNPDPESRVPSPESRLSAEAHLRSGEFLRASARQALVEAEAPDPCPLRPMTESERLVADYAGTGLTVGRHPMALRRDELAMRGVLRAIDLRSERNGRRVRVAGMVITRQRPGTAKGFVFLTLEDETGIANIIVRPDLFARDRLVVVEEKFLLVDGILQHQDGVISVRAESVQAMTHAAIEFDSHDFH
jgi:error-prone DNA polymerase